MVARFATMACYQMLHRDVPTPMQVCGFVAVFPDSGPRFHEECSEPIFRSASGRCNLVHEGRRGVSLCKAGSAPLTSCATSLDAGATGNPSWGVLRLSEHVTLCPFRLKSPRHVQAMLRNHNRRCTARRLEHYSSLREPVLDFRNSPYHFTIVRLIDVQDQCDLVL